MGYKKTKRTHAEIYEVDIKLRNTLSEKSGWSKILIMRKAMRFYYTKNPDRIKELPPIQENEN